MYEPASTVGARLVDCATAVETGRSDRDVIARLIIYLARQKGESAAMTVKNSRVDGVQRGPGGAATGERPRSRPGAKT